MTRVRAFWGYLRGTYWAVPSAMALAAIALSVVMIRLDEAATTGLLDRWSWVFAGGPEGARAVLSTIASSMITVAGVTFSITIVTLTLASQQYGPRLLRNFLRDLGNQIVLGTFVSTFTYCLLVLRTVRGSDDEEFVPHLAVTVGVVLAMLSLGVLIFFIHHVATSIQASRIIANVSEDLQRAVARLWPEDAHPGPEDTASSAMLQIADDGCHPTLSATAGYVQAVDDQALLTFARDHDVVVRVRCGPGAFVRQGQTLATIAPMRHADDLAPALRRAFIIGGSRSGTQDVTFFVAQLVELAVRALSPGINDPGTARLCIDRLAQALCQLAARRPPSDVRHDEHGHVRVLVVPMTFASIMQIAFGELAHHGRSDVSVTCRLLEALQAVGTCALRDADRDALANQVRAIAGAAAGAPLAEGDRERIARAGQAVLRALHDEGK